MKLLKYFFVKLLKYFCKTSEIFFTTCCDIILFTPDASCEQQPAPGAEPGGGLLPGGGEEEGGVAHQGLEEHLVIAHLVQDPGV